MNQGDDQSDKEEDNQDQDQQAGAPKSQRSRRGYPYGPVNLNCSIQRRAMLELIRALQGGKDPVAEFNDEPNPKYVGSSKTQKEMKMRAARAVTEYMRVKCGNSDFYSGEKGIDGLFKRCLKHPLADASKEPLGGSGGGEELPQAALLRRLIGVFKQWLSLKARRAQQAKDFKLKKENGDQEVLRAASGEYVWISSLSFLFFCFLFFCFLFFFFFFFFLLLLIFLFCVHFFFHVFSFFFFFLFFFFRSLGGNAPRKSGRAKCTPKMSKKNQSREHLRVASEKVIRNHGSVAEILEASQEATARTSQTRERVLQMQADREQNRAEAKLEAAKVKNENARLQNQQEHLRQQREDERTTERERREEEREEREEERKVERTRREEQREERERQRVHERELQQRRDQVQREVREDRLREEKEKREAVVHQQQLEMQMRMMESVAVLLGKRPRHDDDDENDTNGKKPKK